MATQLQTRQLADGVITDVKVAAGAAIVSSKLADGANFTKKDGTVAYTGNQSMGNNLLTNLSTPSAGTDAANKSYVDTQIANLHSLFDSKPSAKAQATVNVLLTNPGGSSFDGVTLSNGDRLFLNNQTAQAENGLYSFNGAAAALTRDATMATWLMLPGALLAVEGGGTANAGKLWLCTVSPGGTLGTTAVTFAQVNAVTSVTTRVPEEVPSGSINGSNAAFSLAFTPVGAVSLYLNGQRLRAGGNDYTLSGTSITLVTAPLTGEYLVAEYYR